jgi:membrane protein
MFTFFDVHIGWKELARRTVRETLKDDAQGLAAQLSYYFFLSLFPTLLCLLALATLFPIGDLVQSVSGLLGPWLPADAVKVIRDQMVKIAQSDDTALLSVGALGALWSSSAAMGAVINAMNRAYGINDSRPWWRVRLLAILLTIGLAFFILIALMLVLAGPQLADAATRWLGVAPLWAWLWKIGQWPLAFALVAVGIGLVYYLAPDAEQDWVWITPGSLLATILWLLSSVGFRYYVVTFGDYAETYGALAGVIVVLLWFYLSGLAIVIGAELNAEIEHASPWGKSEGEKRPGDRRRLGAAAARHYHGRRPRASERAHSLLADSSP